MDRLSRSWELFQCSLRLMRDHPKLLVFPFLIDVFTIGVLLFFLVPVVVAFAASKLAPGWLGPDGPLPQVHLPAWIPAAFHSLSGPIAFLGFAAVYLLSMLVATFCNVAFYNEILEGLNGQPVSIRRGIRVAAGRFQAILFWSLLAGLVGLCIQRVEQRFSLIGRLIAGVLGVAWSVASIFAIPLLIRDRSTANPVAILKGSARTIRATWGEALVGYVGLKGMDAFLLLVSIPYWIAAGVSAFFISAWVLAAMGLVWVLAVLVYGYLVGIASKAYLCALFIYATEGVVATPYDASMMDMAWKLKQT
ncbi:MAG: hypothetical protein KGS61_15270 [Verrucomicrobia bacterium]|nr:hypothetical protein [Verrucomicrobiota bacterium]